MDGAHLTGKSFHEEEAGRMFPVREGMIIGEDEPPARRGFPDDPFDRFDRLPCCHLGMVDPDPGAVTISGQCQPECVVCIVDSGSRDGDR